MSLNFNDTKIAFAYKTDKELKASKFLFTTMSYPMFVPIGTRLTPFILKTKLPVKGLIKSTIFKQFVGGETLQETAELCNKLNNYNVKVILDYGAEGNQSETDFDKATQTFIDVINYAATQKNIPFISVKVTAIARFKLLETLNEAPRLRSGIHDHEDEIQEWERVKERLDKICNAAQQKNVGVLIDAEESWIQDPIDRLTIAMMEKYNQQKAIVFNTIQLYRHDRLAFLKMCHRIANQHKFILGVKLVRGAYMEKERERAASKGYPSPIQPNKTATDNDFNEAVGFCIENIVNTSFVVATHNEESNKMCYQLMQQKNISFNHSHIHFSQLYGMSDNLTFNLASVQCSVSKYLPFGPLTDVIPYLMRRAQENKSISGQTNRELELIKKEMERRKNDK